MLKQRKEAIHESCFLQLGCWMSHTGNSKEMAEGPKWSLVEDEALELLELQKNIRLFPACIYCYCIWGSSICFFPLRSSLFPVALGME